MNRLDTSNSSHGQPLPAFTLGFMQDATNETVTQLVQSIVGPSFDPAKPYILSGGNLVSSGGTTDVSSGIMWFNGELFRFNDSTFADPVGPNVVAVRLTINYPLSPDPIAFDDGFTANVHQVRYLTATSAASGSQLFDYADAVNVGATVELRTDLDGDTISFERSRFILYSGAFLSTNTITIDTANAKVGSEIVINGVINNGDIITTTGATPRIMVFNIGANVASAARRFFRLKCVGVDVLNIYGAGAGTPIITITDLNNA